MASSYPPKKNAAFTLDFTLYTTAGAVVNPSTITKYISKDSGYPAAITNTVTEVNATYGMMSLVLTATEMNADRVSVYITATVTNTIPYSRTIYTSAYTNDEIAALVDALEGRLTATRAGYLDALSTGVPLAANAVTATAVTTSAGAKIRTGLLTTASYTTPPTVAAITASIWANSSRTLSDKTGFALTASYTKYPALAASLTTGLANIAAILADTGTDGVVVASGSKTGYALTASYNAAKYATQSTVWTDTKAGYLDAAVTSRAAAATALSTATWTDAKAGYLTGNVALAASLTTANTNIAAILADTGTDGVVVATASKNAIADQVWDEAVSDHVTAGTAGRFLQRVYRYFFNKRTHTNAAVTVYADDGTTADATMVVSGDTTTVTKAAPS